MKPVLDTEEVRLLEDAIEREGTSKAELMEAAGEFTASVVARHEPSRVVVLTGFGNNGGDGWVAADILRTKGIAVDVVTPIEPDEIKSALARHVARRTAGRDVDIHVGPSKDELTALIERADVVVDALLGTGFSGTLRPPFPIWLSVLEEVRPLTVSVDVPSGLDSDTGIVAEACVHADETATMLAPKIGLYSADGPEYAGDIICGELYEGLDVVIEDVDHAAEIVEAADIIDCIQPLPANVNKYTRGSVLVVAGSASYPGAAMLAAKAAARAGAGYVAVAAPDACANLIRMALPSVPVVGIPSDTMGSFGAAARKKVCEIAPKYDCVVCGPGMTTAAGAVQVVMGLLELDVPLVLDADALNCLARLSIGGIDKTPELYRREAPLVLTPHTGELARLVDEERIEGLAHAVGAAQRILWACGSDDLVVVAKGPTTAIVSVDKTLIPMAGPAALATAGSGDVLAGIIGANMVTLRDAGLPWELVAAYAVAVHSYTGYAAAAVMGEKSVIATDLVDCIGDAMQLVENEALKDEGLLE